MAHRCALSLLAVIAVFFPSLPAMAKSGPDDGLKVVIIRHGEKPEDGDNLSCQGENRALQLPEVLYRKFKKPAYTYVPSLGMGDATKHSRMFQTVSPFAIKYNLTVDSQFDEKDSKGVAKDVMKKTGTVLLVWEHSAIPDLAKKLGVKNPPNWQGSDFDSIWIITYSKGTASLSLDKEGLNPSADCQYSEAVDTFAGEVDEREAAWLRATHEKLGLKQAEAGKLFGGGIYRLSEYERGKTQPHKSTVLLLKLLDKHPELLKKLVQPQA